MSQRIRTTVLSIGENKGAPRIWHEGKWLELAGFYRGTKIKVSYLESQIIIDIDTEGDRIVSGKNYPLIDLNNNRITEVFDEQKQVRVIVNVGQIIITSTKKALRKEQRLANNSKTYGSIFSGVDLFGVAAEKAGYKNKWGIEVNEKYADLWLANHKGTMHNLDISEIDLSELEQVELLIGGIPCEPFSIARRNQGKTMYEEHENADLSCFFLMIVEAINPKTIILEEVPAYLKSGIGTATISALKRMGYYVESRLISGTEYGEFTVRKRAVIVASSTKDIQFPDQVESNRTMNDILLPYDHQDCEWFTEETKPWIFKHWREQKAKGNNFKSQFITQDTKQVQAITKRYFAGQGSNPVVQHPQKEDTFRWLTLNEVKKIMGLPDNFDLGTSKTTAGEAMGQGVLVNTFKKIIEVVTQ